MMIRAPSDGSSWANLRKECELHMYGGISKPFGMGYEFAGSDEMTSQIETFLDVQFGYRPLENEVE